MERICMQCHAVVADEAKADWCPACGGALGIRESLREASEPAVPGQEVDHRGIVLPRHCAVGGIITPV